MRCGVCGHHWFPLTGCDVAAARADMHERGCGWCVGHLSASQLETFQLCPRKWGLARIDGIREPESTAQRDGSAYHKVAEAYLATGRIDHSGKYGEWLSAAVPHLPTPPVPDGTIEQWFCFEPEQGIGFRGRVDLWLPAMILDHKTCADFKWAKTPDELATGIQSVLYAHAHLRNRPPGDSVLLRWVYARKRGASASIKVEATITKEQAAEVFRRVHLPLARAIEVARTAESGNDLPPNPRACSAYGGCFYAAAGHCKLTPSERTKALMTTGTNSTMANPDDLMKEIEAALAAPKGRVPKPKATTVNRPKPTEEPAPVAAPAPAPEPDADDEEAALLAQLAAKRAAKAAAAKAAEEALARAQAEAEAKAAAEAEIAAGTAAEPATVEPFDAIDCQAWIAVVAQSGDVELADSTVRALRFRRGV